MGISSPLSVLSLLGLPSLTSLLLGLLSLGPVPKHIAFVMDGNRRWARERKASVSDGHRTGFGALKRVLDLCLGLKGLECVTVYAFAIDNFKRDQGEVKALMEIAKAGVMELIGHGEVIARHQVRLRIIGRKELLPEDVRIAVEKVEGMTKDNTGATLNICIPYASRDEMAGAIRGVVQDRIRRRDRYQRRRLRSSITTNGTANGLFSASPRTSISPRDSMSPESHLPDSPTTAAMLAGLSPQAPLIYEEREGEEPRWIRNSNESMPTQDEEEPANMANGHVNGNSTPVEIERLVNGCSRDENSREDLADGGNQEYDPDLDVDLKKVMGTPIEREELEAHMMFKDSPPLDVLVRTSGVRRLSDFMLWQCNEDTQIHFVERFWPLFGLREMVPILLDFQRSKWSERLRFNMGYGEEALDQRLEEEAEAEVERQTEEEMQYQEYERKRRDEINELKRSIGIEVEVVNDR